ncbi:MAG: winged helix-turn-helix transcriptional regulator, partial [Anaerolineae bacterium]|nr:winged helix-turn-helix transcriptional regulator [Anaerolineae bacterium]
MTEIDRINRKILQILESDGRISNTELASRAGLSASACLRRVQEMERSGVIRGYRALLDREAMGRGFTAIVGVALSNHQLDSQLTF